VNVLKAHEKEQVLTLFRAGLSAREIHRWMVFDRTTVARYAREAGLWPEHPKPASLPEVATGTNTFGL